MIPSKGDLILRHPVGERVNHWAIAIVFIFLFSSGLVGVGSAIFHPESSRVARMASGGKLGLAQSFFQVGGSAGSALGPLLAALLVVPRGQHSIAWFSIAVLVSIAVLIYVGGWYQSHRIAKAASLVKQQAIHSPLPPRKTLIAILILLSLLFSKFFYLSSLSSYYIFYLITKFHLTVTLDSCHDATIAINKSREICSLNFNTRLSYGTSIHVHGDNSTTWDLRNTGHMIKPLPY